MFFMYGYLTRLQCVNLAGVIIDANDGMTDLSEANCRDQPQVPTTNNRDTSSLTA